MPTKGLSLFFFFMFFIFTTAIICHAIVKTGDFPWQLSTEAAGGISLLGNDLGWSVYVLLANIRLLDNEVLAGKGCMQVHIQNIS